MTKDESLLKHKGKIQRDDKNLTVMSDILARNVF